VLTASRESGATDVPSSLTALHDQFRGTTHAKGSHEIAETAIFID
jgi:hypothetical protein